MCGVLLLGFVLLVGMVDQVAGSAAPSQTAGCPAATATTTTGTSPGTTTPTTQRNALPCSPASPDGAQVVQWAKKMADALYVNPACGSRRGGNCNNTYYTSAFPQAVLAYGQTWCQAHGDCAQDWGNGSYQCVSFVRGAYSQVYPMKATNNAFALWTTYQDLPGWQEIPSAATADPAQRSLPEPGDVMVFKDLGVGHVAIVMAVQPPQGQHNGWVAFSNADSSSSYDRMPLLPTLLVDTSEWAPSGDTFIVWGYIRPKPSVS